MHGSVRAKQKEWKQAHLLFRLFLPFPDLGLFLFHFEELPSLGESSAVPLPTISEQKSCVHDSFRTTSEERSFLHRHRELTTEPIRTAFLRRPPFRQWIFGPLAKTTSS